MRATGILRNRRQAENISGQNLAVIKREYDERGNKTSEVFFTQNGTRGCDNEKVHKYYNQYDRIANKVSHQISFGIDGKPVVANNIAAEGRTVYDKRGNMTKIMCYDGYGKSINGRQGWSECRFTYNEAGDITSKAYFDINGKAVADKSEKIHKYTYTYNGMRMLSSESYYGADGKPANTASGYSTVNISTTSRTSLRKRHATEPEAAPWTTVRDGTAWFTLTGQEHSINASSTTRTTASWAQPQTQTANGACRWSNGRT